MTDVSLTSFLLSPCLVLHRCLVEKGDVAFVKDQTVKENTGGMCITFVPINQGRWFTCVQDVFVEVLWTLSGSRALILNLFVW